MPHSEVMIIYLLAQEAEALIRINYQQVDAEMTPSDGQTVNQQRIASLNFNSVDVIGESFKVVRMSCGSIILEILSFFTQLRMIHQNKICLLKRYLWEHDRHGYPK